MNCVGSRNYFYMIFIKAMSTCFTANYSDRSLFERSIQANYDNARFTHGVSMVFNVINIKGLRRCRVWKASSIDFLIAGHYRHFGI